MYHLEGRESIEISWNSGPGFLAVTLCAGRGIPCFSLSVLLMRSGSAVWLPPTVAIAITVPVAITIAVAMAVRGLQGNGGSLGSSAVGVQNAYHVGMLVTG